MKRYVKGLLYIFALVFSIAGVYVGVCLWGGSSFKETLLFLGRFIARPQSVGAVAPSSQRLAVALSYYITPGTQGERRHILEVGPGTGSVTQEIVSRLSPDDLLDIVELDPEMAAMLREKYKNNHQVAVITGSITTWNPSYRYARVVVGIPFNALSFSLVKDIWSHIVSLVASGGVLSYFAYIGLPHIKRAFLPPLEKKDFKNIQRYLKSWYYKKGFKKRNIWSNVPPARVRYLRFD